MLYEWLILLCVAALITLAAGSVVLVGAFSWPDPLTNAQEQALDAANKVFLIGVGSILGLLGGHAS